MARNFTDGVIDAAARRRLRILALALFTLLVCSLAVSAALWITLERVRDDLAAARATGAKAPPPPAQAAAAPAPRPADPRRGEAAPTAAVSAATAAPAVAVAAAPATPPGAAAAEDRLLLLLTVGTRHYAEKQLRLLRQHCRAPLAVYLQRHGRCGWSQCFAVAAREADADLARQCGATRGQALRERADFALVQ